MQLRIDQMFSLVNSIEVLHDSISCIFTDPIELEATLISHNQEHFSQAHLMPFSIPPLSNIYNFEATNSPNNTLLAQCIDSPSTSPKAKLILEYLLRHILPTVHQELSIASIQ